MTAFFAAIAVRPNALDRQIDTLSTHALLTRSAYALVDPQHAAAAASLEHTELILWFAATVLQIGVLAWFWSSGRSSALRDRLRARVRTEFAARFCFGAILALIDKAVALVPLVMQYRFLRVMGLSEQLLRAWLGEWILGTLVAMLVAGLLAAVVLWLADRTHQWYVYTMAAIMAGSLLAPLAAPLVAIPPLQRVHLAARVGRSVNDLRARTGVQAPILEQRIAQRSRVGFSYVAGLGPSQRLVISDTALDSESPGELLFRIARGFAWILGNTALQLALVQGAFLVVGAALAVTISDRIGFRRDDDPVSRLSLLGAVIGVVYLIAIPFYNSYSRNVDNAADERALALTQNPAAAIRAQVRRADQALLSICPGQLALWYLTPHPPPGPRIAAFQGKPDICAKPRP